MKEILLNTWAIRNRLGRHERIPVLVDDEDYEELNKFHWSRAKGIKNKTPYAVRTERYILEGKTLKRRVFMHRLLMAAVSGEEVDHVDGNGLNNQKSNLRKCTHQQNMANRCHGSFKGIAYAPANTNSPWVATCRGKHIGAFTTHECARQAYNHRAQQEFGEFAKLIPSEDGKIRTLPWVPPKVAGKTSKRRGVCKRSDNCWQAYWRGHHLGHFKTEAEAVKRREEAEAAHGSFNWTNPTREGPARPRFGETPVEEVEERAWRVIQGEEPAPYGGSFSMLRAAEYRRKKALRTQGPVDPAPEPPPPAIDFQRIRLPELSSGGF